MSRFIHGTLLGKCHKSSCPSAGLLQSNQAISLKLDVIIGPTNWENWLTSGNDAVLDTDHFSTFLTVADSEIF